MKFTPKEGMFCKTREGKKVGPLALGRKRDKWPGDYWTVGDSMWDATWWENGQMHKDHESPHDLVAEWPEPAPQEAGPVRTETVTTSTAVIQEGTYNDLYVAPMDQGWVHLELRAKGWRAHEIRKIVLHLNAIAEALESQP